MQNRYDAVIFDLDGTLLDTLEDLAAAVNHALRAEYYPERSLDEVRRFVGNGVGMLIRRALPASADGDPEAYARVLQAFKSRYAQHNNDATAAYPGVMDMLETLKRAGVRMAIVSNKNDPNVQALSDMYFAGLVSMAVGEREGVRRKPCPDAVLHVMDAWGLAPERTLYVGDSDVDVQTAQNAGVDCAAVCWGFRTEDELRAAGAKRLFHSPDALARFVLGE